jgi:PTH1 family peptidyl-tRNA hydrolase
MIRKFFNIFTRTKHSGKQESIDPSMKYLIAGLGNIGSEYAHTRHNIGFDILDELAKVEKLSFSDERYGAVAEFRYKGRIFILLKPNTYVNLSGKAVGYWLTKEKISTENLLVVVDDIALPFGALRVKSKGSDAGHNGLKSIQATLGHNQYVRLRFGIDDNYIRGHQANYVLAPFTKEEQAALPERIDKAIEIIKSFGTIGTQQTMNLYNNK